MERLGTLSLGARSISIQDCHWNACRGRHEGTAKQLSATINRATGGNVSRYVNGFRIRHACERLKAGDNVTSAMLNSGFNTKSNFNREFLRTTGYSPRVWLATNGEGSH